MGFDVFGLGGWKPKFLFLYLGSPSTTVGFNHQAPDKFDNGLIRNSEMQQCLKHCTVTSCCTRCGSFDPVLSKSDVFQLWPWFFMDISFPGTKHPAYMCCLTGRISQYYNALLWAEKADAEGIYFPLLCECYHLL